MDESFEIVTEGDHQETTTRVPSPVLQLPIKTSTPAKKNQS